jgi:hypothetical protein
VDVVSAGADNVKPEPMLAIRMPDWVDPDTGLVPSDQVSVLRSVE